MLARVAITIAACCFAIAIPLDGADAHFVQHGRHFCLQLERRDERLILTRGRHIDVECLRRRCALIVSFAGKRGLTQLTAQRQLGLSKGGRLALNLVRCEVFIYCIFSAL